MNRRQFLFIGTAAALVPGAAFAKDFADKIVRRLRKQGYTDISSSRTFLGRVRIVAWRGGESREIILNPYTGEILRDVWTAADGRLVPGTLEGDDDDKEEDDDDKDDEEEDEKDDNSGSGSGSDDDEE
ncbi:MAG: hypothetical protein KA139_04880 [Rhodobacteraceae bacterium]|nr:hypothetical protein [Paracoccaceae bacterium]